MKIDRTTKLLLTIIAVGLWLNLLSTWLQAGQASAATGQTPYTEGISRKDAFFENLTVRNVTISDSNANLRIMIRGGEDGTAQMSFYGERSKFAGAIRVD